jgi:hypothetical protein
MTFALQQDFLDPLFINAFKLMPTGTTISNDCFGAEGGSS